MQIQLIRRRRGTSTPSPPAFSPADIANLVGWWKADAITGLADSDRLVSWPDSSPAGKAATNAVVAQRPLYRINRLNGLPGVVFDGVDDQIYTASPATTVVDGFTLFTLANLLGAAPSGVCPLFVGSGGDGWGIAQVTSGTAFSGLLRGGVAWMPGTAPGSGLRLLAGRRAAGTFNLYSGGGVSVLTTTQAPTAPTTQTGIGSHGGAVANMDIYEGLIYARALTDAELNQIGAYLDAKWGVPWSPVS
jgi:hypothetical protein